MALMPKGKLVYSRGEIRWVRLDPTLGAETRKTRACLIVQNNVINQYGLLTIVLPFLPGLKQAPYAVNVTASPQNGLDRDRYLDVGQIRAVDHQRILERLGTLEEQYWAQIQEAINVVLGFGFSD
jgi:mRNA interferase MazF